MRDLDQYPKVYLQTGDCFLGVQPTLVTTVLGSCVAVTMFSPERGMGAICHAFLPDSAKFDPRGRDPQVCRFVDTALESMLSSLLRLRVNTDALDVKVFGGASGLISKVRDSAFNVGARNVEAVMRGLREYGLKVTRQATGGNQGRKLMFLTHTGDVWAKFVGGSREEDE